MNTHHPPLTMNRRLALLAIAGTAAELSGCGGGGGGGIAGLSSGGTGSFTSGTITGLGSIIVNGIRYDDRGASLLRNDDDAVDSLRVGMVVWVQGSAVTPAPTSGGLATATATRIVYGSEWVGQVTAKAATSFQMLGQTVNVRTTTVFNGTASDLTTLAVGDYVEAFGYLDPSTGQLQATLVLASATAPSSFRLTGALTALDTTARTFTLGGQSFQYTATTPVPTTWAVGSLVRVRFATAPVAGVWQVLRVTPRGSGFEKLEVPERAESELHGTVTAFTSATSFSVNGLPVDARTATVTGTVVLGARVEIKGAVVSGTLVATRVEVETESQLEQEDFKFIGAVSALDTTARTFTLKGQSFSYTATTRIQVSNWVTGATPTVEVEAVRVSGQWVAVEIKDASA